MTAPRGYQHAVILTLDVLPSLSNRELSVNCDFSHLTSSRIGDESRQTSNLAIRRVPFKEKSPKPPHNEAVSSVANLFIETVSAAINQRMYVVSNRHERTRLSFRWSNQRYCRVSPKS